MFGQGTYYPGPVNPPGAVSYSGTTIAADPNLQFLQNKLSLQGVSLETPPTAAQYATAVASAVVDIQNGLETGTGITLTSFSNEAVAWNTAGIVTTSTAIAQAIIQVDFTTNNNTAQAITDLGSVATVLAAAQPTQVSNMLQGLLGPATSGAGAAMLAPGVSQIVVGALNQIPGNVAEISVTVGAGQAAIVGANVPAMMKNTLYDGYVTAMFSSSVANNTPAVIATMAEVLTVQKVQTVASLQNILNTAVAALPVQNNITLAALADGALLANGNATNGPANVASDITGATHFSGSTNYVDQVVNGYTQGNTRANLDAALTANHGFADAIASGAVTRNLVASGTIMQDALTLGVTGAAGDPNPANVVEEAILANTSSAVSTLEGAINLTTHAPYGTGVTFDEVAFGAAAGASIGSIGLLTQILVEDSGATVSTLPSATVNAIVKNAIDGAASANNSGAFGDIVYKSELEARNTSGIAGSLTTTAITEIQSFGGLGYVAAIAAQAGGGTVGTNRSDIQAAADAALASNAAFQAAADQGMALVQKLQSNNSTHFVDILNAINTAANPAVPANANGDAVRSDLYAAMMSDPNDYDGNLAAALKETVGNTNTLTSQGNPVTDSTLLGDANNAIRGINANVSANLQIVDVVVTHIQNEALGVGASGVGDIFAFISKTIVNAPSLVRSIAVAGTTVDPDHAHFIALAVGYQAPTTAYTAIPSIFTYAQITTPHPLVLTSGSSYSGALTGAATTKSFPGSFGAVLDQPAVAAAITAAVTDGIVQANQASPSSFSVQSALSTAIASAVSASITQNGTALQGMTNPFNAAGSTSLQFQQSNGTQWNGATPSTSARSVGAAGAITGYIAEVTQPTDTTISATTQAVLSAAVGGSARPYALQMAQAAGQAFAWVTQFAGTPDTTTAANTNPVYAIANAMAGTVVGYATLSQLENAVAFGMNQAELGVIGAGALGLNATNLNAGNGTLSVAATGNANSNFYVHRSGTGSPVTDIFNL